MKIFSNEKLIKRNTKIGSITSLSSIVVLGVGMYFSFQKDAEKYLFLTFSALILGFLLFQVGNYFTTRWGRPPRPDQKFSTALKGLDDKFTLYHYETDISHLLIGPSGIFCLLPYNQGGKIYFDKQKNRWKQSGGNFFLKTFGGESLGKPELDIKYAVSDAKKYFLKQGVDLGSTEPEAIIVFMNDKANVTVEDSPTPAVAADKLKEYIRKRIKTNPVPGDLLTKIQNSIQVK